MYTLFNAGGGKDQKIHGTLMRQSRETPAPKIVKTKDVYTTTYNVGQTT